MTRLVNSIPYDIWHQIASYLGPHDYVHLSLVNRQLHGLLRDEVTARKSAQAFIPQSAEGRLAVSGQISYRQALGRVFDVREAVATAQPYSASLMAYADEYNFKQGVLCYKSADCIRVLDVHGAADVERVLDVKTAFCQAVLGSLANKDLVEFSLLHYCDGIVSCLFEAEWRRSFWLLAFDVGSSIIEEDVNRIRVIRRLNSISKIFVRNNDSVLYYGTHSQMAQHGHYEWLVQSARLVDDCGIPETSIQLENVVGSEIGSTVCFEIRDGYFYAVSNQTSFEDEEIDWTSFYICVRFPLRDPKKAQWYRFWRRQHQEGPINDSWTDLSLGTDEATGNLMILESRREWRGGGSENYRTYYTQAIDHARAAPQWSPQLLDPVTLHAPTLHSDSPLRGFPRYRPAFYLPDDDPLTTTLDAFSKPNYEPPKKRVRRQYHDEYSETEAKSSERRDFTLSKTKFRTYNPSASSFIDLVNDPITPQPFSTVPDRLRLRIGSRKRKCPIDEDGEEGEKGLLYRPEHLHENDIPMEYSEDRYESRGINYWPPDNAPAELTQLLSPHSRATKVEGIADERTIVYSSQSAMAEDERQAIILVNFDPTIRFKHLKRLKPDSAQQGDTNTGKTALEKDDGPNQGPAPFQFTSVSKSGAYSHTTQPYGRDDAIDGQDTPDNTYSTASEYSSDSTPSSTLSSTFEETSWFSIEPAKYLSINRGFWLR